MGSGNRCQPKGQPRKACQKVNPTPGSQPKDQPKAQRQSRKKSTATAAASEMNSANCLDVTFSRISMRSFQAVVAGVLELLRGGESQIVFRFDE